MTTAITPYLDFAGRCDEALAFYGQALGAEVEMIMRFSESPEPPPPDMLPPGFENKVMHASFRVKGIPLMATDGCGGSPTYSGIALALTLPGEAEARQVYDALTDGGTVQMPLGPTFWSPCFGMLNDRFGVGWMIMVPPDACVMDEQGER
jgi:PhnB protein